MLCTVSNGRLLSFSDYNTACDDTSASISNTYVNYAKGLTVISMDVAGMNHVSSVNRFAQHEKDLNYLIKGQTHTITGQHRH